MKVLTFLLALSAWIRVPKPHNDNLRAGQSQDQLSFSPWKALVS